MKLATSSFKLRIAIALTHIHFVGGIERFTHSLANWLNSKSYSVLILSQSNPSVNDKTLFSLQKKISVHYYDINAPILTKSLLIEHQIDCVVALYSDPNIFYWLAILQDSGIPLLYSEHSNPHIMESEWWNPMERNTVFASADTIHLLLDDFKQAISTSFHKKTRVIGNPILIEVKNSSHSQREKNLLISVGRLSNQAKQYDLLIAAFAHIATQFPDWRLEIWGDGPHRPELERLATKLGLNHRIFFKGITHQVEQQYQRAELFCISSKFEGFGMTATEAMAHGLPVVGFAECSGVNTIVQHGVNGLLAPEMTAESLAAELSKLMGDHELRNQMSEGAYRRAADFDREKIFLQWEEMILECASHKGNTALQRLLSTIKDPDHPYAHAHISWMQGATSQELLTRFDHPALHYFERHRNSLRVKLPWKVILFLWNIKQRLKNRQRPA